jgi:ankyrin repeat protein
MLLEKGADPDQTDKFNKTAMDYAIEADKMPIVELLKKHGAKSTVKAKAPGAKSPKKQGAANANKKQNAVISKPVPKGGAQETPGR